MTMYSGGVVLSEGHLKGGGCPPKAGTFFFLVGGRVVFFLYTCTQRMLCSVGSIYVVFVAFMQHEAHDTFIVRWAINA